MYSIDTFHACLKDATCNSLSPSHRHTHIFSLLHYVILFSSMIHINTYPLSPHLVWFIIVLIVSHLLINSTSPQLKDVLVDWPTSFKCTLHQPYEIVLDVANWPPFHDAIQWCVCVYFFNPHKIVLSYKTPGT